jgi:hypothetical protein
MLRSIFQLAREVSTICLATVTCISPNLLRSLGLQRLQGRGVVVKWFPTNGVRLSTGSQTFYRWKAKYAALEVDQVRQMAQLQEENLRLKKLVAELVLDKTMLQDVLSKKW